MDVIVTVHGAADPELLRERLPGAEIHEVPSLADATPEVAREAQVLVLRSGQRLDAKRLTAWPKLGHVIRAGSGLDGIDTAALADRGITLHRNPHPAAAAVAEWALAALLSLARRIPYGQAALLAGTHTKPACLAPPASGMRLAIWGGGLVGRACADLLGPHVAETAYAARPGLPHTVPARPALELPGWADAHLVALPLTDETRGMFGAHFLAAARPRRPLLVCVGRLATLDVAACLSALADGQLGGVALDPVERSDLSLLPPGTPPLNLLATPHIGAQRTDVRSLLDHWVAVTTAQALLAAEGSVR